MISHVATAPPRGPRRPKESLDLSQIPTLTGFIGSWVTDFPTREEALPQWLQEKANILRFIGPDVGMPDYAERKAGELQQCNSLASARNAFWDLSADIGEVIMQQVQAKILELESRTRLAAARSPSSQRAMVGA